MPSYVRQRMSDSPTGSSNLQVQDSVKPPTSTLWCCFVPRFIISVVLFVLFVLVCVYRDETKTQPQEVDHFKIAIGGFSFGFSMLASLAGIVHFSLERNWLPISEPVAEVLADTVDQVLILATVIIGMIPTKEIDQPTVWNTCNCTL
eukprot:TRINITY_DN4990_c0_g1_i1.p1 TRINITY_DN4990_c0_g1~~TRINITY_DN4990_c0_g1_i1.p1  ORF type:complete len:147 (+),score=2.24 TRINITY_DN4990_c0_g1_i1:129-569(+)